jgi:hypothetical protein
MSYTTGGIGILRSHQDEVGCPSLEVLSFGLMKTITAGLQRITTCSFFREEDIYGSGHAREKVRQTEGTSFELR